MKMCSNINKKKVSPVKIWKCVKIWKEKKVSPPVKTWKIKYENVFKYK